MMKKLMIILGAALLLPLSYADENPFSANDSGNNSSAYVPMPANNNPYASPTVPVTTYSGAPATGGDWLNQQSQQYLIQQKLQTDIQNQQYQYQKEVAKQQVETDKLRAKCIKKLQKKCAAVDLDSNNVDFNQRVVCQDLDNYLNYGNSISDSELGIVNGDC